LHYWNYTNLPQGFPDTKNGKCTINGAGWRFVLREPFASYFPAAEFHDYAAFLDKRGVDLKTERRTRVVLLRRRAIVEEAEETRSFILKEYRYPLIPRIRTWLRISKAEQEFNSLLYLGCLGIQAAEPVAFGVARSRLGFVHSCFLVTRFVENAVTLSDWSSERGHQEPCATKQTQAILKQLGEIFRRLHQARFFLFTAKAKNILVQQSTAKPPEILFIDVPYARSLRWWPLARWAQCRDLGVFLGSFPPGATEHERTPFYDRYLPDPLNGSDRMLRWHVRWAIHSKQNQTPISAFVHRLKQAVRKKTNRRAATRTDR